MITAVNQHLYATDQLNGFSGSLGPSQVRYSGGETSIGTGVCVPPLAKSDESVGLWLATEGGDFSSSSCSDSPSAIDREERADRIFSKVFGASMGGKESGWAQGQPTGEAIKGRRDESANWLHPLCRSYL